MLHFCRSRSRQRGCFGGCSSCSVKTGRRAGTNMGPRTGPHAATRPLDHSLSTASNSLARPIPSPRAILAITSREGFPRPRSRVPI